MNFLFFSFYFIWQLKQILFWLYFWQLKEYHLGRIKAHFQTSQGKRLIFDKEKILKILSLFFFKTNSFFGYFFLFFLYLGEVFFAILKKKFKFPVWTKKTIFLFFTFLFLQGFIFYYFYSIKNFYLFLLWDIFLPFFFSLFLLFFQPFSFAWRIFYLEKAKRKIEKRKGLTVIAIIGSYGKTTTKEFLFKILSEKFNVLKTKEHQNSETAIFQTVLNELNEDHQIFIAEIGAYNKGQIGYLSRIIQPTIGVITGVNEQHLATFGSMENLLSGEGGGELIDFLSKKKGILFLNGNNYYCQKIFQERKSLSKVITFVAFPDQEIPQMDFDFLIKNIKIEKEWIEFELETKKEKMPLRVNLAGPHHLENLILAIAVSYYCFKMSLNEIKKALERITLKDSSFRFIETKKGFFILDSTYSANPQSVFSHLNYLSLFEGKKIFIFPSLIELGEKAKEIHKRIGREMGKKCDFVILTSTDFLKELKENAKKSGLKEENIFLIEDPKEIFEKIKSILEIKDVVLLEGRLSPLLVSLLEKYGNENC